MEDGQRVLSALKLRQAAHSRLLQRAVTVFLNELWSKREAELVQFVG
jgi:hypothetical protein